MSTTSTLKRPGDSDDGGSGRGSNNAHHPPQPASKIPRTDGPTAQSSSAPSGSTNDGTSTSSGSSQQQNDYAAASLPLPPSSASAKKKAGNSSRTGQACDRCKVRKIRCDARPGGCSPCLQNHTECKTTDRITGRATSRGHTEHIESENASMKMYILELQQQLRDTGVEPKAPSAAGNPYGQYWGQQDWAGAAYPAQSVLPVSPQVRSERQTAAGSLLPDFRSGCIGDNYLGVSSENSWLSSIEGTSLALFGTKIDLAEFMPADSDPTFNAMSYRTFLSHAFGRHQVFRPELPAYEQCKVYAEWYFRSIQVFTPVLHRPDFMALLYKVHHENYQPKPAENVMLHMVLAQLNFQFAARNANEQAREDSMSHYHYACSFIPDLMTGHTIADIQALALICAQLRCQPKPGAAWMFTNLVLGLAIESGLHRSAKAWPNSSAGQDAHTLEMRKRIFWSLLISHVHISGKLGRPMPLRLEDFDIEIPEPIPDNLPEEASNQWRDCSFRAAIEGFKLCKVMMQLYSTIYSIKSTGQYEINLRHLQKEVEAFHAQIPTEFRIGPQTRDDDRVSAYYLDMGVAECQLLLHHPALCRSASPQLMATNLDTCLLWSTKLLQTATAVKNLNSLDTTWYSTTNFLAAIFTTLFAHTERRDQMSTTDLQRLRQDMNAWMEIMKEVASLIGLSSHLQAALRAIIDFSLGNIQRHIAAKTASAALPATTSPTKAHASTTYSNSYNEPQQFTNGHSTDNMGGTQSQSYAGAHADQNHAYSQAGQYEYPLAHQNGIYPSTGINSYSQTSYAEDSKPNIEEQLLQASSLAQQRQAVQRTSANNFMAAFQAPTTQAANGFHPTPTTAGMDDQTVSHPQAGPAAWRHFADSIPNLGGHEYINSAAGLMAIGGVKGAEGSNPDMVAAAQMSMHLGQAVGAQTPWPLMQYAHASNVQH